MQARLNMQMLNTTSHDSGALGPLAMVVHPFTTPGHHRGVVVRHGRPLGDFSFVVDAQCEVMQLDIDLARVGRRDGSAAPDCGCHADEAGARRVSPKGYVLFHASSGSGYAATVGSDGAKAVFDSTRLSDGDLFALSLLEPGAYRMDNTLSGARGSIEVAFNEEIARRIRALDTVYVDAQGKRFSPGSVALASSQGLVFRIHEPSRIVIAREGPARTARGKPALRWQKPAPVAAAAAQAR